LTEVPLLVAFGAGIISFVSPCVLPLLPGYLSLMSGYSIAELETGDAATWRMLRATGLFVAGFTLVFVALGAGATAVGSLLRANLDVAERVAGWIVVGFGILLLVLSLSDTPRLAGLTRERRVDVQPSRLGMWAPPVMGVAFGFAWTPCIGPVLGAILTTAAVQESVGRGMLLLLVYGLGLGVPFMLAGVALGRAMGAVRWLRSHSRPIGVISSVALIAFGLVMVTGNLSVIASWVTDFFESTPLRGIIDSI
jgi:cytochrome c-type biogenesis protein